jgi:hypothetical protein
MLTLRNWISAILVLSLLGDTPQCERLTLSETLLYCGASGCLHWLPIRGLTPILYCDEGD